MSTTGPGMDSQDQSIKALFSQVLDLPPNCLKFSKVWPDHFVVGTYFLEEDQNVQPPEEPEIEKTYDLSTTKQEAKDSGDNHDNQDVKHDQTDASSDKDGDEEPKDNVKAPPQKRSGMLILCQVVGKSKASGGPGVEV